MPTRTPKKHASQQRTCSRPSFRSCCEPQCNDRRSKDPRNEDSRPSREDRRNEERPRDCVRQQEKLCQRAHVRKLRSGCATVSEPLRQPPREAGVGAVLVIQHVLDECCIHHDRAADLTLNSGGQLIRAAPELSETEVPERALGKRKLKSRRCAIVDHSRSGDRVCDNDLRLSSERPIASESNDSDRRMHPRRRQVARDP